MISLIPFCLYFHVLLERSIPVKYCTHALRRVIYRTQGSVFLPGRSGEDRARGDLGVDVGGISKVTNSHDQKESLRGSSN